MTDPSDALLPGVPASPGAAALPAPGRRRRRRRRLFALLLGAALVAVVGLALELGVRLRWERLVDPREEPLVRLELDLGEALRRETLTFPIDSLPERDRATGTALYLVDPARGIRLRPLASVPRWVNPDTPLRIDFTVNTDRHGCRGPDRALDPAAVRVLVVGDSMTFGEGVEDDEAFPAVLERLLAARLGRPAQVYNAGVVSYGQREQLETVRQLVGVIDPHLVLLQFTAANDCFDNVRWLDERVPLERDPAAGADLAADGWLATPLARWSRLYRLAVWRWGRHAIRYRHMRSPALLDRAAELIGRAREAAGPRPFGVLVAPSSAQVEDHPAERLLDTLAINRGLVERLAARDVPALDPLEALRRRAAEPGELYIPLDRHWTPAGHQAVADALLPWVLERLEQAP